MQEGPRLGGLTNALSALLLSLIFVLLALYTCIVDAENANSNKGDFGANYEQEYYRSSRRLARSLDAVEQHLPYQHQHAHIVRQRQQVQESVDDDKDEEEISRYHYGHYKFLPPVQALHGGPEDELELLDICLVASVDGKFHALNRTSGQVIWSMASSTEAVDLIKNSNQTGTGVLDPLVRTQHHTPPVSSDDDDFSLNSSVNQQKEIYIIEPQTGAIFVLSEPDAPLQRLPFTMAQLVDMSPFTLPGDDEHRVFVGRKETSLVVLELETGRVKSTVNSECPWDPFAEMEFAEQSGKRGGVDTDFLDELEGKESSKVKPVSTEILIGRTDYHVSIHTRPRRPFDPRPPVQTLIFSTYGPNNQDHAIQATYRRAPDDIYIQPMSNGEVMAFKTTIPTNDWDDNNSEERTQSSSQPLWGNGFGSTVVTVFDILQSPSRRHPIALLQPQPRIHDVIPNFPTRKSGSSSSQDLDTSLSEAATYIGLVPETQALFALSADRFPLAATFSRLNYNFQLRSGKKKVPAIEGYVPSNSEDVGNTDMVDYEDILETDSIDGVSALLAARARCENGFANGVRGDNKGMSESRWDLGCLVGKRPVVASGQSRLSRLLPDKESNPDTENEAQEKTKTSEALQYASGAVPGEGNYSHRTNPALVEQLAGHGPSGQTVGGGAMSLVLIVLGLWYLARKKSRSNLPQVQNDGINSYTINKSSIQGREVKGNSESSTVESTMLMSLEKVDLPRQEVNHESNTELLVNKESTLPTSSLDDFVFVEPEQTKLLLSPSKTKESLDVKKVQNSGIVTKRDGISADEEGADDSDRDDDGGEGEGEKDTPALPGRKKPVRRRKRGKKNKGASAAVNAVGVSLNGEELVVGLKGEGKEIEKNEAIQVMPASPKLSTNVSSNTTSSPNPLPQLDVSDEILGYGSHGTVVFRGSLQGRAVAVKRLLQDFVTLASREVMILQESDDHPNVIRYYYQEAHGNFLYIALELCPASLADVVEHPDQHRELAAAFEPKRALAQIASGLRHLHALKIIHRDIKPQNILISSAKKGAGTMAGHRMLISDFGLCKRLEVDQTSFLPTAYGAMAAGTAGWRAPEILRGDVKLDEAPVDDSTQSSRGSVGTVGSSGAVSATSRPTRLTKSVDIFALGCLFYYILTSGGHPYGDRYEREINILKDEKSLRALESFGEEGLEAIDLITSMLDCEAPKRPDTTTCLIHPFFWNPARRLGFLQDASDRFEIMCRDPRDANLVELERDSHNVVGNDWQGRLDKTFLDSLGKYRKYDGKSVQDLMRALRNKKNHYQDLPDNVKRQLGPLPDGFLSYFTRRFPHLFMHVHAVIARTNLRYESIFKSYFELTD